MPYWFYENTETKCELCHQDLAHVERSLCQVCVEAIIRLLRATGRTELENVCPPRVLAARSRAA